MKLKLFILVLSILLLSFLSLEYDVFRIHEKRLKKLAIPSSETKDKSFVFIIPAHNCSEVIEKTLRSIDQQTYKNYRIIFIDDCSNDFTYQKMQDWLQYVSTKNPIILKKNSKRKGIVESLYEAVQSCENHEIVVFFEANSWLVQSKTLEELNTLYKNYDIWLAYTQFANYRTLQPGKCKAVTSQNFFHNSMKRKYWAPTKLKTFYAGLFKKIPLDHFFFRGKFISEDFDKAYMFPMMEMAQKHVTFLKDIHLQYVQNKYQEKRPCDESKQKCNQQIFLSPSYSPLKTPPYIPETQENKKTDLLLFSYDRPLQLYALLESVYAYVSGFEDIFVIYRYSTERFNQAYKHVKKDFPKVHFLHQKKKKNFQPLVNKAIFSLSHSDYILFSVDDIIMKDKLDLSYATSMMERTKSYFFSLRLGKHIKYCYMGDFPQNTPHHIHLQKDIIAWQLDSAKGDWTYPHSLDMTLYRKSHLKEVFPHIHYDYPNKLEPAWENYVLSHYKQEVKKFVGLSYTQSKAVNIPLNIVFPSANKNINLFSVKELLKLFEEGFKIDILSIHKIHNDAVHIDHEPIFIKREFN